MIGIQFWIEVPVEVKLKLMTDVNLLNSIIKVPVSNCSTVD